MITRIDLFALHTRPLWITLARYSEPLWGSGVTWGRHGARSIAGGCR